MSNIAKASKRMAIATAFFSLVAWAGAAASAQAECVTKEKRCGKDWAFCPDNAAFSAIVGDGCSSIEPNCPRPAYCPPDPKRTCGEHWTDWRSLGEAIDDPCPAGCVRTERVDRDSRTVNAFFQFEYRERWACAGTPLSKEKRALK